MGLQFCLNIIVCNKNVIGNNKQGAQIMSEGSIFDFRSDTVTRPDDAMRAAMAAAEVGDDVYGDDKTTANLEARVADMLGKAAGLFVSSGTQSNLIAILCHAARGEEFLSGQSYHTVYYEAGGAATLGGVIPCPLPVDTAGRLSAADIDKAVKPDDFHHPVTRLLCLENTVNGRIQTAAHLSDLCAAARRHKLYCHLDGARLMNAAVACNMDVSAFTASFDSVSLCLSKGLAAPVGSVLVGDKAFISRARRLRKQLGGGMRQVGMLAAAGHYALNNNISRLHEDHQRAFALATALKTIQNVHVDMDTVETNMVYMDMPDDRKAGLKPYLAEKGLLISPAKNTFRLVTHKDISEHAIKRFADAVASYMREH